MMKNSGKFKIKIGKNRFIFYFFFYTVFFIILLSPTFAELIPVKEVIIESESLSYVNSDEGSWKITKSAKWISKGKARITLKVESIAKANNDYTDVILVLDTSGSMNGERLDKVKSDTTSLINEIVLEGNNVALITFSDNSEIITDFTNDSETLINYINDLEAVGNTNYYQALVNVDTILKDYEKEETRDCVVLFLTDGYPNIDSPNEEGQYEYLKSTYPDLTINGIQYEMGEEILEPLEAISDNQYVAYVEDLEQFLYKATVSPIGYEKFEITDYIENDYFNMDNIDSIVSSSGTYTLEDNKVTWNLDGVKTGTIQELTIDINLNEELVGVGGVYPTNEQLEVNSVIENSTEEVTSTLTPILADNYSVIYDGNSPEECTISGVPNSINVSVFDTVSISTTEPSCDGYQFKGWELVSDEVEKVNSEYFIMPEEDVTLRATWSKISLDKAMDGKVSQVQNLYQMMADNSVPDNIKSEFVTSSTGINFGTISSDTNGKGIYQAVKLEGEDTPIYYYRGAVDNNNLIFANFCWKIVRTTETKGVKLIYNGVPNEDGSCTATGEESTIGKSTFNSNSNSIAYNGYMYGEVYEVKNMNTSIVGIGGKNQILKFDQSESNYIYSSTVTYDEASGLYTVINGENRLWNDTYSVDTGNQFLYTCLSETKISCSEVYFITQSTDVNTIKYVAFTSGETADDIWNEEIVYGNDVIYDEETGMYTLQTTMTSKIRNWETDKTTIGGQNVYHYTCLNETGTCPMVKYINYITSAQPRNYGTMNYIELTNGIKIEEAINKMTTDSSLTTSSTIKKTIDTWYENNMTSYTDRLENTIWCNDRTISEYGGWDKNGNVSSYLYYQKHHDMYLNYTPTLICRNSNDAYTLSVEEGGTEGYGNNSLKYPLALLTEDEIMLAGGKNASNTKYYLYTGQNWCSMTPNYFDLSNAYVFNVYSNGSLGDYGGVKTSFGVRPSISLKAGTRSIDGDGSPENPFIVE